VTLGLRKFSNRQRSTIYRRLPLGHHSARNTRGYTGMHPRVFRRSRSPFLLSTVHGAQRYTINKGFLLSVVHRAPLACTKRTARRAASQWSGVGTRAYREIHGVRWGLRKFSNRQRFGSLWAPFAPVCTPLYPVVPHAPISMLCVCFAREKNIVQH
jgi:hypothetical protein